MARIEEDDRRSDEQPAPAASVRNVETTSPSAKNPKLPLHEEPSEAPDSPPVWKTLVYIVGGLIALNALGSVGSSLGGLSGPDSAWDTLNLVFSVAVLIVVAIVVLVASSSGSKKRDESTDD